MTARLIEGVSAALLGVCVLANAQTNSSSSLSISPATVVFPSTPVGSEDAPQTITLTNLGDSSLQLEEIIVSGIDFGQSNDCRQQFAAGASCKVQIVFKPAISGERLGNLEIVSSGSKVPYFVALSGSGE